MEGRNENHRAELSYRLCCPRPKLEVPFELSPDGIEISLSYLPWRIRQDDEAKSRENATSLSATQQQLPSFLDLRRQQNIEFAEEKCREANNLLQSSKGESINNKAKTLLAQALDLVPDHLGSLISSGKLFIKIGKFSKAEGFLRTALRVDEDNVEALQHLVILQEKRRRSLLGKVDKSNISHSRHLLLLNNNRKDKNNLTARESSAYQNALMERNLFADRPLQQMGQDPADDEEEVAGDSSMLHDSIQNDQNDDDHNRSKKNLKRKDRYRRYDRKERKKHRKRRKREKKYKKKKRSRRRYARDDLSSCSSSSSLDSLSSYSASSHSSSSSSSESRASISSKKDTNSQIPNGADIRERAVGEKDNSSKSTATDFDGPKYNIQDGDEDGDSSRRHKKRRRRRHDRDEKRRHKRKREHKRHKKRKESRRMAT